MSINASDEHSFVNKVYRNIKSDYIEITDDKLENILTKHKESVKKSRDWITPLSVAITILIGVLTADFNKDFIGIPKTIWAAIFYISLMGSIIWCVIAILNCRRHKEWAEIEYVINKIKNSSSSGPTDVGESKETAKDTETINKKNEGSDKSIDHLDGNIPTEIKESFSKNSEIKLSERQIEQLIKTLYSPKYSMRTANGISNGAGIALTQVSAIMEHLVNFGFVESKIGTNGTTYWRLLKYPIKIYSANYGIPGHYADVTGIITNMIANGELGGVATQTFFKIPDPAPQIYKYLKIHYRIHGIEKDLTVGEGSEFQIG
jgi:hypothetical protein